MTPFRYGLMACSLSVVLAALMLAGCGSLREDDDEIRGSGGSAKRTVPTKPPLKPIQATKYADIKGSVFWEGDVPEPAPLTFTNDRDHCSKGSVYETVDASYWVGGKGDKKKLGNVFVWLEAPKDHYFAIPPEHLEKFKGASVKVHQPHCAFVPRAAVLFPQYYTDGKKLEETGQKLIVVNDAKVQHNANIKSNNNAKNESFPAGTQGSYVLEPDDSVISVTCGVHTWMKGYLRAFTHPYATVTNVGQDPEKKVFENRDAESFGTYVIKDAPVGTKLTLVAWHETLGFLERRPITVQEQGQEENFTAKRK